MEPLKNVNRRRDQIEAAILSVTASLDYDANIDGPALSQITSKVLEELPPKCRYDTLHRTLTVLLDTKPKPTDIRVLAAAIAANAPQLRTQNPIVPGRIPIVPTRVLIQVTASRKRPTFNKDAADAAQYRGRILIGPGAPTEIEWAWSLKFVGYYASHPDGFGFDRLNKPTGRPYRHFSSLVGMRFTVNVCREADRVKVGDVKCAGTHRVRNQALTAMRNRKDFACPFAFEHACHLCPKGQVSCPAAHRHDDLETVTCNTCSEPFTVDPAWPTPTCDACRFKRKSLI